MIKNCRGVNPRLFHLIFESAATGRGGRNFYYTILSAICQAKFCTKLHKYFIPYLCNIPSCNSLRSVLYYHCQGEGTLPRVGQLSGVANCWQRSVQIPNKSARNFFKRNFEKPLDKLLNLCYNTDTNKGEQVRVSPKCGEKLKWGFKSPTAPKKSQEKRKKVLDKPSRVCYNKNVKRNPSYRIN